MPVVHQERVAWDGATAFVRAAAGPHYAWFAARVRESLGDDLYGSFAQTRNRLLSALVREGYDGMVVNIEAGRWRALLEDAQRYHPELAEPISRLTIDARELRG